MNAWIMNEWQRLNDVVVECFRWAWYWCGERTNQKLCQQSATFQVWWNLIGVALLVLYLCHHIIRSSLQSFHTLLTDIKHFTAKEWNWSSSTKQTQWLAPHNLPWEEVSWSLFTSRLPLLIDSRSQCCNVIFWFNSPQIDVHLDWKLFWCSSSDLIVIEKYTQNTRFCLICNYINKIIPALQSRCTRFRFGPLERSQIEKRLNMIAENEQLSRLKELLVIVCELNHDY